VELASARLQPPNPTKGGLAPGDPLLRRAQDALGTQLGAAKLRLEAELREKRKALIVRACAWPAQERCQSAHMATRNKAYHWRYFRATQDAGARREAVGVELYGFQQQLARLQRALAAAGARAAALADERAGAEARAAELRRAGVAEAATAAADEQKALAWRLSVSLLWSWS